ncbi:hypothetical protein HIM_04516 [Hirsutella minnesotensis 3608]|uniref:Uncharacterized protein n=1 Tax=Hirsutella minnesotensis 3608 TaxID=1043627 RepID=A0A0F7ZPT5_9HYPO|nr:hypothetical protein HIM_04516 [Hirsutella minnesotensis 3608]
MDTTSNMASEAAKAVWADSSQQKEPISGVQGDVPRGQPYDAGNLDASEQQKMEKAFGGGEHYTTSSIPSSRHTDTRDEATSHSMPGDFPSSKSEATLRHDPNQEPKVHAAAAAGMDLHSHLSPRTTNPPTTSHQSTNDQHTSSMPSSEAPGRSSENTLFADKVSHDPSVSHSTHHSSTTPMKDHESAATRMGDAAILDQGANNQIRDHETAGTNIGTSSDPIHSSSDPIKDSGSSAGHFCNTTVLSDQSASPRPDTTDRQGAVPAERDGQVEPNPSISSGDNITKNQHAGAMEFHQPLSGQGPREEVPEVTSGKDTSANAGEVTSRHSASQEERRGDPAAVEPSEESRRDAADEPTEGEDGGEPNVTGQGPKPVEELAREHGGDAGNVGDASKERHTGEDAEGDESKEHESKGTGEQWVKTTGFAADGGDFDAAKPGAGKEADRLMEQKGMGGGDGDHDGGESGRSGHKDKPSLGERIKEKLHVH